MAIAFDLPFDKSLSKKKNPNARINSFESMVKVIYISGYVSEYTGYISNTCNYLMKNIHVSFPEYGCKSSRTCSFALRTTNNLYYILI